MWRVAGVFFREPGKEHGLVDVTRKVKLAHTSVKAHLAALRKEGIIRERIELQGGRRYIKYRADVESETYRSAKRIQNLLQLEETHLIAFLQEKMLPDAIVLFGSYAKGEDLEESDIDLYLACEAEAPDLASFERKLGRRIQLHRRAEFKRYPAELKNNIANGVVLSGYLEAF